MIRLSHSPALLTLGGATGFNLYLERARIENREQNLTAVSRVLADLRKDAPQGKANPGLGERLKLLTDAMPGIRTLLSQADQASMKPSTAAATRSASTNTGMTPPCELSASVNAHQGGALFGPPKLAAARAQAASVQTITAPDGRSNKADSVKPLA